MDQNNGQQTTALPSQPQSVSASPEIQTTQTFGQPSAAPRPPSTNYFIRLFSGRVNRRNYIVGNLLPTIILILLTAFLIFINGHNPWAVTNLNLASGQSITNTQQESPIGGILIFILILVTLLATIFIIINTFSLMIRRFHDLNKSGWFWLLSFIPFVGFFLSVYLLFFPGSVGENKFGSQPLPRINIIQDILRVS